MALQLKQDPSSVLRTCVRQLATPCNSSSRGSVALFWLPLGPCAVLHIPAAPCHLRMFFVRKEHLRAEEMAQLSSACWVSMRAQGEIPVPM